ncbi:MAG: RNA methyltransferase [Patescibacteria group bacterium]
MRKLTTEEIVESKGDLNKLKQKPKQDIYLILDNIRSMYNVGAIFRTADAAGIKKLYLCGITAAPPRKEIEKTALKTVDFVDWEHFSSTKELVLKLKEKDVKIVALEQTEESVNYHTFSYDKPLAIIIGHETEGIDQEVLDLCDCSIEIPMHGIANSLNVATAAGIILYKATESNN